MSSPEVEMIDMLAKDNKAMKTAGCKLAEAALRVVHECDGVHRLMLATSEWSRVMADEGGRGIRHKPTGITNDK